MKKILVTGAAGFIGYHLCNRLLKNGYSVIGLDNINDYYDQELKFARLSNLGVTKNEAEKYNIMSQINPSIGGFRFIKCDLNDLDNLKKLFEAEKFDYVCNLAAQAGVRYSITNPKSYIDSNINGFHNILELCRHNNINRLVYASSSSVYGNSENFPLSEGLRIDKPISLYAATKISNELMASCYSHLYGFESIGLRFFTVYGPWGRPDMALFLFVDAILKDKTINIFNDGNLERDFTYIDDIIDGVFKTLIQDKSNLPKHRLYNIGSGKPIHLNDFIEKIENTLNKKAKRKYLPMQPGDVKKTYSTTNKIESDYNYKTINSISFGINSFIEWYKEFYKI